MVRVAVWYEEIHQIISLKIAKFNLRIQASSLKGQRVEKELLLLIIAYYSLKSEYEFLINKQLKRKKTWCVCVYVYIYHCRQL